MGNKKESSFQGIGSCGSKIKVRPAMVGLNSRAGTFLGSRIRYIRNLHYDKHLSSHDYA